MNQLKGTILLIVVLCLFACKGQIDEQRMEVKQEEVLEEVPITLPSEDPQKQEEIQLPQPPKPQYFEDNQQKKFAFSDEIHQKMNFKVQQCSQICISQYGEKSPQQRSCLWKCVSEKCFKKYFGDGDFDYSVINPMEFRSCCMEDLESNIKTEL